MDVDAFERVEVDGPEALWAWLENHHGQPQSVWLVTFKRPSPSYVSRDQVLDALIAYGWIDGVRKKVDDSRTMQLISPRKQQAWAQTYKDRVGRLRAEGRMRAAGEAAVAEGMASGKWDVSAPVDALLVPDDLDARLGADRVLWDRLAPSYRRNVLRWIASAKRDQTRADRVAKTVASVQVGEKMRHF